MLRRLCRRVLVRLLGLLQRLLMGELGRVELMRAIEFGLIRVVRHLQARRLRFQRVFIGGHAGFFRCRDMRHEDFRGNWVGGTESSSSWLWGHQIRGHGRHRGHCVVVMGSSGPLGRGHQVRGHRGHGVKLGRGHGVIKFEVIRSPHS